MLLPEKRPEISGENIVILRVCMTIYMLVL